MTEEETPVVQEDADVEDNVFTDEPVAEQEPDAPESTETEDEEQKGFPMPPVEIVLHNAITDITHIPTPQGVITLARFVTPAMSFTLKLDERGKNGLIRELLEEAAPSGIAVPQKRIILPGQ